MTENVFGKRCAVVNDENSAWWRNVLTDAPDASTLPKGKLKGSLWGDTDRRR
ncbi:hypothetical protein [Kribbella sp. CA-294648]|uniref:hypothetical protein n=1 Tax=Kribbella sp. CA-294648 TaxID=3239948 RepID=UPI003D94C88F